MAGTFAVVQSFDVVAESEVREVLKSLVSNIWLHYVSITRLDVPLD